MQKKIPIITQTSSLQLKNGTVESNVLPAHQMVVFQDVQRPSTTYICNLKLRNAPGLDLIWKTPYWQKTLAQSTHFNILSLSMVLGCPIISRSDMCESILDLLSITAEIDIKRNSLAVSVNSTQSTLKSVYSSSVCYPACSLQVLSITGSFRTSCPYCWNAVYATCLLIT